MGKRQLKQFGLLLFLSLFLLPSTSFAERNWNVGDSDLPAQLQGLSQDQLNMINKTDELNPSSSKFNPDLLGMFLSMQQSAPAVRTGDSTTINPNAANNAAGTTGGTPTGIGTPPAASDGPTTTVGGGLFGVDPDAIDVRDASSQAQLGIFFGQFFAPDTIDEMVDADADIPPDPFIRWFFGEASGNAGSFGDGVGVMPIPQPGTTPGSPPGGASAGPSRDTQEDNRQSSVGMWRFPGLFTDSTLLGAINEGNLSQAASLIEGQIGQSVGIDPRGQGN